MELIGNGVCNDEANNEDCKYDGGDCSGTSNEGGTVFFFFFAVGDVGFIESIITL